MRQLRGAGIGALVLASIAVLAATATGGAGATDGCQAFLQTGHQVCGAFLAYWQANGGLAQQGYPISEPMQETSATDGVTRTVQYFERAEFESHPDLPNTPVLLTLLGSQAYRARYGGSPPVMGTPGATPATNSHPALAQYQTHTPVSGTVDATARSWATVWAREDATTIAVYSLPSTAHVDPSGYRCSDFPSQAAAQAWLRAWSFDPAGLDPNKTGIACQGNPAPYDLTPVPR